MSKNKSKSSKSNKSTKSTKTVKSESIPAPTHHKMEVTTEATETVETVEAVETPTVEAAAVVVVASNTNEEVSTSDLAPRSDIPVKAKGKPGAPKKNLVYPDSEFTIASLSESLSLCKLTVTKRLDEAVQNGTVTRLPAIKNGKAGRPTQRYILTELMPAQSPTVQATENEPEMIAPAAPTIDEPQPVQASTSQPEVVA